MAVRVIDKTNQVESGFTQKASIFLRGIAEDIVKESEPNTPKNTGGLRRDVVKQVLGLKGKIIWGKRYAVYQEEKQYRNYTTPGTGPHYAKNAVQKVVEGTQVIAKRSGLI